MTKPIKGQRVRWYGYGAQGKESGTITAIDDTGRFAVRWDDGYSYVYEKHNLLWGGRIVDDEATRAVV